MFAVVALLTAVMFGQETQRGTPGGAPATPSTATNPWACNLTVDGYIVPNGQSYVNPVFTANRNWLHLEARYNSENLYTGSLWAGYNFSAGKKLVLSVTPMIGGVFGKTTGIAPGLELSLTYKKIGLSLNNEYVFDTTHKSGNIYEAWPQLTYSLTNWFRVGAVAQRTAAFRTTVDVQRGILVGVSRKKWEFTTYVFDPEINEPTVVLEVGVNF